MRHLVPVVLVLGLLAASCSGGDRGAFEGFRDLEKGSVIDYRVHVGQVRTASGLGADKRLASRVRLDVEEEATSEEAYALVVRAAEATGEDSQRVAAQRLVGRRLVIDLADGKVGGDDQAFPGTQDIAAADVGMLFVLFAPVIPSPRVDVGDGWRVPAEPVRVPWSLAPLDLTVTHKAIAKEQVHGLDSVRVKSVALGNVRFRLPLVVPRSSSGSGSGSQDLIVNQLFESLFADIDNPIEGVAAAIAAIPLAVAAPFLAIGEALGNIFGGGSSSRNEAPAPPVIDLSGPLELRSDTHVWDADGRVLDALGRGTAKLSGRVPDLPGSASDLSGKTLHLDIDWTLDRIHTSAFPEPRDPPGRGPVPIVAALLAVVALGLASVNELRRRRAVRPAR